MKPAATFASDSLSAAERHRSEEAFAQARDCVIVATSTLELGIDVGDLDRVIQIDSPSSVASFLQRVGRTGRRPGSTRKQTGSSTGADGPGISPPGEEWDRIYRLAAASLPRLTLPTGAPLGRARELHALAR